MNDNWTDEVLNSLEGMQKASPGPVMLDRIKADISRLKEGEPITPVLTYRSLFVAAAGILLLISLNIGIALNSNGSATEVSESPYGLTDLNFDLYEGE